MTDTTSQHIVTREDADLVARLVAAAEQAHIPNPESFVHTNIGILISTDLGDGSTITTSYAYAHEVREQAVAQLPPSPGMNPGAVTDDQLHQAVSLVWNPTP